jgi:hypothetical protein
MNENSQTIKNIITPDHIQMILTILEENPERIEKIQVKINSKKWNLRPEKNSWSAMEILLHLCACADIWGTSILKMLVFDEPKIIDLSPRKWEKIANYSAKTFQDLLVDYKMQRQHLLFHLYNLNLEDWSRSGWISERRHTIFSQCRRMALHERSHMAQFQELIQKFNE